MKDDLNNNIWSLDRVSQWGGYREFEEFLFSGFRLSLQ